MLRAAGWCVGLFGTGAAIVRAFPSAWVQPLVLLALGIAFLVVSRPPRATRLPARAPKAKPTPTPVPVEQSA